MGLFKGKKRSPTANRFIIAGALLMSSSVLMWVFSQFSESLFPAYRSFSKAVLGIEAQLLGIIPFTLWDIIAALLVVATIVRLVQWIMHKKPFLVWLGTLAVVVSAACFAFVGLWALNHYAPTLSSELDLEVEGATVDELAEVTAYHLTEAARLAPEVPRTAEGTLEHQDFYELARIAGAAYEEPAETYEVFSGATAPVKALLVWGEPLLYSGHTGIFFAPTAESGVPLNCADVDLPFVMCHEAAHRLGLAKEEEANFAAYVACVSSDDLRFVYAGHYQAFVYCYNKLRAVDAERAAQVIDAVAAQGLGDGVKLVLADKQATNAHYDAYEGPFESVGTTVNDSYLKSFGETQGVQSYGFMVNYLISWHNAGRD